MCIRDRRLAEQILDEQIMNKSQVETVFGLFQKSVQASMSERTSISSTELVASLEDAIDIVMNRSASKKPQKTAMMAKKDDEDNDDASDGANEDQFTDCNSSDGETCSSNSSDLSYRPDEFDYEAYVQSLPEVDIFLDPGIWVSLDEGCNSNCHGEEWMQNARAKYDKLGLLDLVYRIHGKPRKFKGIGGIKIQTNGKYSMPTCQRLLKSGRYLPGKLHSHEQPGRQPLLLSDESQARLGFKKDMRSHVIQLADYEDDEIPIYRAKGSGLRVICISNFPDMANMRNWKLEDFADKKWQRRVVKHIRKARKQLGMDMVQVIFYCRWPDQRNLLWHRRGLRRTVLLLSNICNQSSMQIK